MHKWDSQPKMKRVYMGNYLLSNAILCSGNNYKKIALLFKFMNIGITSSTSHHQFQRAFTVPAINSLFNTIIEENFAKHKDKELIIAGKFKWCFYHIPLVITM